MKHEIIERFSIQKIESEIHDKTKILEEVKILLRKLNIKIAQKRFGMKSMSKKH